MLPYYSAFSKVPFKPLYPPKKPSSCSLPSSYCPISLLSLAASIWIAASSALRPFSPAVIWLPCHISSEILLPEDDFFFFVFLSFPGPLPWHMEVLRLGVLMGAVAAGLRQSHSNVGSEPSATYTTAHGNARSLTRWARPGIEPTTLWFLVGFVNTETWWELLPEDTYDIEIVFSSIPFISKITRGGGGVKKNF